MKRLFLWCLTVGLVLAMLVSCAGDTDAPEESTAGADAPSSEEALTTESDPTGSSEAPSEESSEAPSASQGEESSEEPSDVPSESGTAGDEDPPAVPSLGVLSYTLRDDGTYAVTGVGSWSGEHLVIPERYEGKYVRAIGEDAFRDQTGITHVTIPVGVTEIGAGAFAGCTSLLYVDIPMGVEALEPEIFLGCTSLVRVTVPASVSLIAARAFRDCPSIAEVINHSALPITAGEASYGYVAQYALSVHAGETRIRETDGFLVFDGGENVVLIGVTDVRERVSLVLPQEIGGKSYTVGAYAFDGLPLLEAVTVPATVPSIGEYAFAGCTELTRVAISSPQISAHAFENCTALAVVNLFEGISSIGEYAFAGCSSILSLTLPESLTALGDSAFRACTQLNAVQVPKGIGTVPLEAFYGCTSLERVVLPEGICEVKEYAFAGCTALSSVTLPATLQAVGRDAFVGCPSLIETVNGISYVNNWVVGCDHSAETLDIRAGTVGIASYALSEFKASVEVLLPSGLRVLSPRAFDRCGASSVLVPSSVQVLTDAFVYLRDFYAIYYEGEREKWESIGGSTNGGYTVYFYSDEPPTEDGFYWRYVDGVPTPYEMRPATAALQYTLLENGTYAVTGLSEKTHSVVIPAWHEGKPVTELRYLAYEDYVVSLTLPETLRVIKIPVLGGRSRLAELINYSGMNLERHGVTVTDGVVCHKGETRIRLVGDFAFYVHEDDRALVSYLGEDTEVVLPTLEGGGSYRIAPFAFAEYFDNSVYVPYSIQSVTIPEGVTEIDGYAFYFCMQLRELKLPESLERIGEHAFSAAGKLRSVTLPAGLREIGVSAFYLCDGISEVINHSSLEIKQGSEEHGYVALYADVVHNGTESRLVTVGDLLFCRTDGERHVLCAYTGEASEVTLPADFEGKPYDIRREAFRSNRTLTSVTIPEGVEYIGESAFENCRALKEVSLPSTLRVIGASAFDDCEALESIEIPEGLETVERSTFSGCKALKTLFLPEGVRTLGKNAFAGCEALSTVVLPLSLEEISSSAFDRCSALPGLYYMGTFDRRNGITVDTGGSNVSNLNWYYYSESEPTEMGNHWRYVDGIPTPWE